MTEASQADDHSITATDSSAIIAEVKNKILGGENWFIALLAGIGRWEAPEEDFGGDHYQYLIGGEAFDWLLLAERIMSEMNGIIPDEEQEALLFKGLAPIQLSAREFRELIGITKYRAYLNYLYGVLVEDALQMAVEEEVRKESVSRGMLNESQIFLRAFEKIYGKTWEAMLGLYTSDDNVKNVDSMTITERKGFIYWLFKYRFLNADKARVASDTKKGLNYLNRALQSQRNQSRSYLLMPGLFAEEQFNRAFE